MPGPGQYGLKLDAYALDSVLTDDKRRSSAEPRFSILDNPELLNQKAETSISIKQRSRYSMSTTAKQMFNNTTMSKVGKSLTSTIRTDRGNSFGRAQDRFKAPTGKKHSPSPNAYFLNDSIGYDDGARHSPFKTSKMLRAVFGKEDRSAQFNKLLKPMELTDMPGPGTYAHWT